MDDWNGLIDLVAYARIAHLHGHVDILMENLAAARGTQGLDAYIFALELEKGLRKIYAEIRDIRYTTGISGPRRRGLELYIPWGDDYL